MTPATNESASAERAFLRHVLATLAHPPQLIFQGPVADSFTHIGQLAMLRRLSGSPVRPESYARARIATSRVGRDQDSERREFDGDASAKG